MSVFFDEPTPEDEKVQTQIEQRLCEVLCKVGSMSGASPLQVTGALVTLAARSMAAVIDMEKRELGTTSSCDAFKRELAVALDYRAQCEAAEKHPLYNVETVGRA